MSRNKDRYESSNNRRQQIFMSQEDVAAGRKSNWTGVEITGRIYNLNLKISAKLYRFEMINFLNFAMQAMYAMLVQLYGNSII